jgi:hypothetical protein
MPSVLLLWEDDFLTGVLGFEPREWRDQNPLPYHLATPHRRYLVYLNSLG